MMSAPGRGSALLRSSQRICAQCTRSSRPRIPTTIPVRTAVTAAAATTTTTTPASRRRYATEASTAPGSTSQQPSPSSRASPPPPSPPPVASTPPASTTAATPQAADPNPRHYTIQAGIILTRAPLLTREQTPFESAFYLYQKRLNERLTAPFRPAFYFKPDTALDLDWRLKLRERHGVPAKDIGRYNPRGRMAWNDEVMAGSPVGDPDNIRDKLLADAEVRVSEDGEPIPAEDRVPVERPMPRRTEADEKADTRRLDRALDKTLYLVVKKGSGEQARWEFPSGLVTTDEALHETAARVLAESAGVNMNTWMVGRVPVAHHVVAPELDEATGALRNRGTKIFYLKGRILAGQVTLTKDNLRGVTDFQWLTKDELNGVIPRDLYPSVRGMFDLR
ncbi:hypothetical protein VTJ83DRAFT_801 [Remersonia thermophila]|uniref:Large ribosomal subunit protein mL46 n=1 Tax=Remersonia thermophila TaxID=72144 RepID=A0ABR4DLZ0_9PEZI